jgi:alkylhydroperoxidase/carboxymuconolactone decarboxylase family protein YurZ
MTDSNGGRKQYPEYYQHLKELVAKVSEGIPGTMGAFARLHKEATAEGVLETKTKELISLGIAIAVRCDGCISYMRFLRPSAWRF